MSSFTTISWKNNKVMMIDQRKLPVEEIYNEYESHEEVADAIKNMVIRGAPAIGVAAAMGIALWAVRTSPDSSEKFIQEMEDVCDLFAGTRPTAVNLFWAIERMRNCVRENINLDIHSLRNLLKEEAVRILNEDIETCRKIGDNGSQLLDRNTTVFTHCNAGGLATAGYGTALGVIRSAHNQGKNISVISSETRPFLQGARLTAWELSRDNIPVTLITDSMAGHVISRGMVNAVIVGADRIASNGDVANKIGTYTLSVLARYHNIPFYVAAPVSTIDFSCDSGDYIPIEQRDSREITHIEGKRIAADVEIYNPAFDITPNENVTCIITEKGIVTPPYQKTIRKLMD